MHQFWFYSGGATTPTLPVITGYTRAVILPYSATATFALRTTAARQTLRTSTKAVIMSRNVTVSTLATRSATKSTMAARRETKATTPARVTKALFAARTVTKSSMGSY